MLVHEGKSLVPLHQILLSSCYYLCIFYQEEELLLTHQQNIMVFQQRIAQVILDEELSTDTVHRFDQQLITVDAFMTRVIVKMDFVVSLK